MKPQHKSTLTLAVVALLAIGALALVIARARTFFKNGEQNAKVWFYDQSERKLYAASAEIIPPDKGIGGKKDDGVRATVVVFRAAAAAPDSRRIAYLQTYTPQLKTLLERARATRAAGQPFPGQLPSRDSDYFQTNTLVRAPGDPTWHPSSSPEAQRLMSAWRSWLGPAGQSPTLSVPD
jgi:hypothetical protein